MQIFWVVVGGGEFVLGGGGWRIYFDNDEWFILGGGEFILNSGG